MQTRNPTFETKSGAFVPAGHTTFMWQTVVVLLVAFYFIEHTNIGVSQLNAFRVGADELAERAAAGDAGRRIGIPILGCLGLFLLAGRGGEPLRTRSMSGWLLLIGLAWAAASILWSASSLITLRRFSVLLFCTIGALGVARRLSLRELCTATLVVTSVFLMFGLCVEIALGTFRPFAAEHRFSGTVHPNAQAPTCALMAISAACLASQASRQKAFLWSLCVAGVVLLVLTKSRTVCGAMLAGLFVFSLLHGPWTKRLLLCTTVISLASTLVLVLALLGWDVEERLLSAILIGRPDEADSLSGRLPLWSALLEYAWQRPLLGYGYLTFWSPERIEHFSTELQWAVPDGHNAYLDLMLDLGLVGAFIYLLAIFVGIRDTTAQYFKTQDLGYAFLFSLILFRAFNGLLESAMLTPTNFVSFVMVTGLLKLGFFAAEDCPAKESCLLEDDHDRNLNQCDPAHLQPLWHVEGSIGKPALSGN